MNQRAPLVLNWRVHVPLFLFLLTALGLGLAVFGPFLLTFTIAVSGAILLDEVQKRLASRFGGRRGAAAGLLVGLTALVILVPVLSYGVLIAEQAGNFLAWLKPRLNPQTIETLSQDVLTHRFPALAEMLRSWGTGNVMNLVWAGLARVAGGANEWAQRLLGGVLNAILDSALFLMMLFFLLRDGPELHEQVRGISPLTRDQEAELLEQLSRTVKGVFLALVVVPLAQGVVACLGFLIFGVPSPVLWAVMVVFAALVPIIGSPLGWLPAVGYLFLTGESGRAIGMLLYGTFIISMIDNVIKPLILRGAARVHTMFAFLSILGGIYAFGPKGMVAGPVVLSLLISAYRIYRYDVLRWREEPEPIG